MRRSTDLLLSLASYLLFVATFLYLAGFVMGVGVPKTINDGPACHPALAIVIDLALVALFGLQHSVMARPSFKRAWTRVVPRHLERSVFVLVSSALLAALMAFWRPLPAALWDLSGTSSGHALLCTGAAGWALVLLSSFAIDHFHLFGLSQTVRHALGRPETTPSFRVRGPYLLCRHPLMLGFLIAFWSTPTMTAGHLLFAGAMTLYILVGLAHEERDLERALGRDYTEYKRTTPRLIPFIGAR